MRARLLLGFVVALMGTGAFVPRENRAVFHNVNREPVSVTVSLGDGSKTWSFVLEGGEKTGFGFTVDGGETNLEVISRRGLSRSKTFGIGYLGSYTSDCFWLDLDGIDVTVHRC